MAGPRFSFDDFTLDAERRELARDGAVVAMPPQAFDLLLYLVAHRDRVLSKDDLVEGVWGGRIVSDSTLTTHINTVRKALGDSGEAQRYVKTLPRKGVRFVGEVREGAAPVVAAPVASAPADRPSIAVLPLTNMGGDPEQEYFADGVSEDIITALSKSRWFLVIARNSTFAYKGRAVDIRTVGRELGARYVLEGSVRRAGTRVRLTAQLIDASNGAHVWAERYDRELTDIFAVQDELTRSVCLAIEPALARAELHEARRRPPQDLRAWDHWLRGWWHFHRYTAEESQRALAAFEQAAALAPDMADTHAALARIRFNRSVYRFTDDPAASRHASAEAARKALALDDDTADAHYILSLIEAHGGDIGEAVFHARRAVELNLNFAAAHFALAVALAFAGQPEQAVVALDEALRLSPGDPQRFAWLAQRASSLYLLRRYDEAIETANRSLSLTWFHTACRVLAASLAQRGDAPAARAAMQRLLASDSADKTIAAAIGPFRRAEDRQHIAEGLRQAGMPESDSVSAPRRGRGAAS